MASQGYYGSPPQDPNGAQTYQMQPPPQYGQPGPDYNPQDGKGSFDQAFKIDKPKWNDLWAGILVR